MNRPARQPSSVPTPYNGITYASSLEADWALTLDTYGIGHHYEAMSMRLDDGQVYWCDLWIPGQSVWCEVKGPHDVRIDKPRRLARMVSDPDDWRSSLVVVARPGGRLERADKSAVCIEQCPHCGRNTFVDLDGAWQCRCCGEWFKPACGKWPRGEHCCVEFVRLRDGR